MSSPEREGEERGLCGPLGTLRSPLGATAVGAPLYAVCSLRVQDAYPLFTVYLDTSQIFPEIFKPIYLQYFNYSWALFRDFKGILIC